MNKKTRTLALLLTVLTFALAAQAYDAPLVDNPSRLGQDIDPNILLLLDDSGSMYADALLSDQALALINTAGSPYAAFGGRDGDEYMDFTPDTDRELLSLCPAFNALAYDPKNPYRPWNGLNPDGEPMQAYPFPDGYDDPYRQRVFVRSGIAALATGFVDDSVPPNDNRDDPLYGTRDLLDIQAKYNLANHFYLTFKDDGDGVFEAGECGPLMAHYDTDNNGEVSRAECLASSLGYCVVPASSADQQNYANWFSYSRRKTHLMKSALATIIDEVENSNLGLAVFNNEQGGVGRLVSGLDSLDQRNALKQELFEAATLGSTPLRQSLQKAGEYFKVAVPTNTAAVTELFGTEAGIHNTGSGSVFHSADSPLYRADRGGYCQRNTTIMFTDGVRNGGDVSVGDADLASGEGPWDDDPSFRDARPTANTLADVAMFYFENDLWAGAPDLVDVADIRDKGRRVVPHQHMVTSTINFGVSGTLPLDLDASLDFPFDPTVSSFTGWPVSAKDGDPEDIDDVVHAAWNGRGIHASASSSEQLVQAFERTVNQAVAKKASSSAAAVNTGTLEAGARLYRSFFDSRDLYGDLVAFSFTNGRFDFSNPSWSADEKLRAKFNSDSAFFEKRNVISYKNNSSGGAGVAFTPEEFTGVYSEGLVNFIRGKNDEPGFRRRPGVQAADGDEAAPRMLGTFINSPPLFVDDAPAPYPDFIESKSQPYSAYLSTKTANLGGDKALVFAGSNGGMLHAFEANTGEEVFAYVPGKNLLANNLADLGSADSFDKAYVDGRLSVADVYVNNSWRTFLAGGLRTGGRGIYVLDISGSTLGREQLRNAESNANDIVVGEFTHPELNFVYGEPQMAKMQDGSWAAIFGNGFGHNPLCSGSFCGQAALFILNLESFAVTVLRTAEGAIASGDQIDPCLNSGSRCNGLATPTLVDIDGDQVVDRAYAGDLLGNMWVFDLSGSTPSNWKSSGSTQKLFTACNSFSGSQCSQPQPITSRPRVTSHPTVTAAATRPNLMVYFGSGQYIDANDHEDEQPHAFYGVWDAGNGNRGLTSADLQQQTIIQSTDNSFRTLSNNTVDYYGNNRQFGWFIELTTANSRSGERVVSDALLIGELVYFVTIDPDAASCGSGGRSYVMGVNALDGSNPDSRVFKNSDDRDSDDQDAAGLVLGSFATGLTGLGSGEDSADSSLIVSGRDDKSEIVDLENSDRFRKPAGRRAWSIIH